MTLRAPAPAPAPPPDTPTPRCAGRPPRLTDAELLTLAVAQALLGVRSEARWLRLIPARLPGAFPYLPGQSGCAWRHLPRSSAWRRLSAPASSRASSLMASFRG